MTTTVEEFLDAVMPSLEQDVIAINQPCPQYGQVSVDVDGVWHEIRYRDFGQGLFTLVSSDGREYRARFTGRPVCPACMMQREPCGSKPCTA